MPSHELFAEPRPRSWHRGLLVLGLLVGLLGMHGLGSVPQAHARTHAQAPMRAQTPQAHMSPLRTYAQTHGPRSRAYAHPASVASGGGAGHTMAPMDPPDARDHDAGGKGGHPEHADSTCASGAITGSPALAAPPASAIGDVPRAQESETVSWISTDGGRAPPSLAHLQLLRI
ncbi:DUF6153 family protein [Streptomyces sp. NPDC020403]|uniref:DUF6153 family protein n=1 Tax=unclassified Streptomyces TaxID=2593676 RepID=UPI0033DD99EC